MNILSSMPMSDDESAEKFGDISELPPELVKCLQECHDKLSMDQLQDLSDYVQSKINALRSAAEGSDLTIEDFEKAKKEDLDNDNEEGEKGEEA